MAPKRNAVEGLFSDEAIHRPWKGKGPWYYQLLNDPWVAAMRLEPQAGRLVVAEVHIFAMAPKDEETVRNVSYSGEKLTSERSTIEDDYRARIESRPRKAPAGGLPASAVRKIAVTGHLRLPRRWYASFGEPVLGSVLTPSEIEAIAEEANKAVSTRRKSDLCYALIAEAYVRHCAANPKSPIKSLAKELNVIPATLVDQIHTARKDRELLTEVTQGRPGGELTPKAKSLLAKAKEKK